MAFYRIAMKQYKVREVKDEWVWHSAIFRDHISLMGAVSMFYRGSPAIIFGATSTNRLEDSLQDFNEGRLCAMITTTDLLSGRLPFDDAAVVKAEQIVDNERIVESREVDQRKTQMAPDKVHRRLEFYRWLYLEGRLNDQLEAPLSPAVVEVPET